MNLLGTLRSITTYVMVIFFSLMAGFAIASIAAATKEKFEEQDETKDVSSSATAQKGTCPSKQTPQTTVSQQIVVVFQRELGRVPTLDELQFYSGHFTDEISETKLVGLLHQTAEYKHAIKMQTNLVNADTQFRMNDRQIDLYINDNYRRVFKQPLALEKLAWLRLKFAEVSLDCGKFEAFLINLKALEMDGDQMCVEVEEPIDDMIKQRNMQDRQPHNPPDENLLQTKTKPNEECSISAAPDRTVLGGTPLDESYQLIMPVGKYVLEKKQAKQCYV